jgi:hypothetical protein
VNKIISSIISSDAFLTKTALPKTLGDLRAARSSAPQPSCGTSESSVDEDDFGYESAIVREVTRFEKEIARGDDPEAPYQPFITAVHARSRGYAYRTPGVITGRNHHNLSRGEEGVLQLLDSDPSKYANIREQFPVPVSLTWLICKKRNWPHPYHKDKPAVLTVDFLVTLRRGGWVGIDFKKKKDLDDNLTKRKLAIMAEALRLAGATHKIMTDEDLPRVKLRNLRFLHQFALPFDPPPLSDLELDLAEDRLNAALRDGRTLIFDAAQRISAPTGIPAARLSRGAMWCIACHRWAVDLNRPIGPDHPVTFLK